MHLELSPFDSRHYGLHVGRLVADGTDDLRASIETARRERCDVVFVRLAAGDPRCGVLEQAGHRPVDTLITSTLGQARPPIPHAAIPVEHHARLVDPADLAAVIAITTESIRTSHLHADPRLPLAKTHALYAEWIRNDVTGRAQHTLIAREGGSVVGYLTVVATTETAMIDLVAVRASAYGRGVGSALIARFIEWIDAPGSPPTATVGTQLDNPALRLYARCGFIPSAKHFTYHLWLDA